ncbi:MAG: cystathionine gamma-synthase [Frankiaceae bacterium]|jgi:cystathionine beta-lyase/cystathionine gamma-synthase|nr:cystathionine gamma-synthase [Frankiaceae bacterium]
MSDRPLNLPIVEPGDGSNGGEGTRAVHTPRPDPPHQLPVGLPTYRTSTFEFETAQQYADVLGDREGGYTYSRIDNPTADAFALGVAAMEGYGCDRPIAAQPFASGMAAISTVLLTLCSTGRHVVAPTAAYGGTYGVLEHVLARFGVDRTYVDGTDVDAVRDAITDRTAVVWAETIANPTTAVADLPALAAVCAQAGVPLVVDSTFASPAVCRPLAWGANLVVHSATKYLGGHSDVTGGAVAGDVELVAAVRRARVDLGGSLGPDDAFLLHRGLATLPVRMGRHCATALAVAEALADHPGIERIDYPGLPGHPQHELAGKLFTAGRYGAVVTITPRSGGRGGGRDAGMRLCDGLRVGRVATSLGGVHTLVSHVASTTHRQFDDATLAAAGIPPAAVRFSIGLEDADDLIADVSQALESL